MRRQLGLVNIVKSLLIIIVVTIINDGNCFAAIEKVKRVRSGADLSRVLTEANTRYIIYSNHTLNNRTVTIGANSILDFQGGVIRKGTLVGDNTIIIAPRVEILGDDVTVKGSWNVSESYPEWFGAAEGLDCLDAINKAIAITSSDVVFSLGEYLVSNTIYTKEKNLNIKRGAVIKALNSMTYMISMRKDRFTLNDGNHTISGGGKIDGNAKVKVLITCGNGLRNHIYNLYLCGATEAIFKPLDREKDDNLNVYFYNCILYNTAQSKDAVAVYNNKADCIYQNLEIIDFRIAIDDYGVGKYTEVHPWISNKEMYPNSVAFNVNRGRITLVNSEGDSYQYFVKFNVQAIALIINGSHFINKGLIPDSMTRDYPPLTIFKGKYPSSVVSIYGGRYDRKRFIDAISSKDIFSFEKNILSD